MRVLIAGRRDIIKNIPNQLHALAQANEVTPVQVALCIKGDAEPFRDLCQALKLPFREHPWGSVEHFRQWIATEIDLAMCCSYSETFCYVAADCMQLGIPVIGSHCVPVVHPEMRRHPDSISDIAALVCDTVRHYRDRSRKAVDRFAEIQTRNNREWLSTIRKLLGNAIAARGDY